MCSTRNCSLARLLHISAAVVASATPFLLMSGCQRVQAPRPDRLNDTPLLVDEAMQIRDYDRSTATYANGGTVAGSARLTFEPKDDSRLNYAADPAIGLANFVIIPFTYFGTPPFTKIEHHGAIVPPTYTAEPQPQIIR
jgi:hypothetical protein